MLDVGRNKAYHDFVGEQKAMKVFCAGRLIGEFKDDYELFSYMTRTGYYPNVFVISDHGNPHFHHMPGFKYNHLEYHQCNCEAEFDYETDYVVDK